ncbi:Tn3 family transposase [Nocardia callitridis]|uniref:Tn3 family transposase n=1 Tax=Nocardia callitridis TaxID=648753 RepID=UPI003CD0B1C8
MGAAGRHTGRRGPRHPGRLRRRRAANQRHRLNRADPRRVGVEEHPGREIKAQANLTEGRHDLARRIFHGRKGKMTRTYYNGTEDQLEALGLVLNRVALWNTATSTLTATAGRALRSVRNCGPD